MLSSDRDHDLLVSDGYYVVSGHSRGQPHENRVPKRENETFLASFDGGGFQNVLDGGRYSVGCILLPCSVDDLHCQ